MALLMVFALIAGAGTALSPCVLPVLPVLLAAGATGGPRRPLGIVTGLALSFTFATVALVYVIEAIGLPDDLVRDLAIAVLLAFGLSLLLPPLGDRIEAAISRFVPAPRRPGGEGLGSGLLVGASLGLVYAPCAGPILAGVITVSASQAFTAGKLAVALSYAIGSAIVLYALILGGRRLADRLAAFRGRVQMALGAVMVAVAALMLGSVDTRFQTAIADDLPAFLVNPTGELEESEAVTEDLAAVRGGHAATEAGVAEAGAGAALPRLGAAPEFTDTQGWFNTPGGRALSITELTSRRKVVLLDFWTYTCINCLRTLPYLRAWDSAYRDDGLVIVGIHAPEFAFEKEADNVERAIADNEIRYPVVQDNEFGTWTAYGNRYWPAKYLVGADGQLRYVHFGEGAYETTEAAIRSLLAEAGDARLGAGATASAETADPELRTPETYLGYEQAQGFVVAPHPGVLTYDSPPASELGLNQFAYGGRWRVGPEAATAVRGATLSLSFQARRVFLVLGSERGPGRVRVLLDGEPITDVFAGEDVSAGAARITRQRLYRLVDLPEAGRHSLELRVDPGIAGYAFTFG
jgi:cytochrome c biogenesis protein CcdA/thiol-disulfide isomerase/thioredoxin